MTFDVAIVGAGPAGSTCAALCARAGLRTLLVERATFPREKVCGDCLNPACWPVLDQLGLSAEVAALPHARLREVEFVGTDERSQRFPLPTTGRGEIAVKRSALDALLLGRALASGAALHTGAVTTVEHGWKITAGGEPFAAHTLVAADGRNSTVARLLGILPAGATDRVGVQTHLPARPEQSAKVTMRLLPFGYCGIADVGGGEINACLVARPHDLQPLQRWAQEHFAATEPIAWRTIAPLSRAPIYSPHASLLLVGDAARVVEPFTGEGIYYALASGALAADLIIRRETHAYPAAHRALYRGRLWINRLAKAAVLHPQLTTALMRLTALHPAWLASLTARVTRTGG